MEDRGTYTTETITWECDSRTGQRRIVIEYECDKCHGTGLYRGVCEKDGAAVVCHYCNGSGSVIKTVIPFEGKKRLEGVKRVYDSAYNRFISAVDLMGDDGRIIEFSKWGCTYEEWLAGVEPAPMKGLVCPYLQYNKGIGHEPLGEKCIEGIGPISFPIDKCKHYADKAKCWEEFEQKQKQE